MLSKKPAVTAALLAGLLSMTMAGQAYAAPSPAPQPVSGERYLTAMVNGKETKYLAPARNDVELQAQINAHLKRAPGGVQISKNQISYMGGKFIMTFALPGQVEGTDPTRSAPDVAADPTNSTALAGSSKCSALWFCFFDGVNYTYPRGQLSDCGFQDLNSFGWVDRVESVAQNLLGGYVDYRNHTSGGHGNDEFLFFTDTLYTQHSTVPYPNVADHVYNNC
ncbi:hypothetical protein ACN268_10585 [Micromonospora sp. WMMD735]|uniref:hypothetical protein n=1 Tax=Micromonospora sp. WMMD735 TaxID=3404130 RepID=UPI003B961EC5